MCIISIFELIDGKNISDVKQMIIAHELGSIHTITQCLQASEKCVGYHFCL